MCKKKQFRYCPSEIDSCMEFLIVTLNDTGTITYGCCCGHYKYHMTIVVRTFKGKPYDLLSQVDIPRKINFYKRDEKGYYYIPEVEAYWKSKEK